MLSCVVLHGSACPLPGPLPAYVLCPTSSPAPPILPCSCETKTHDNVFVTVLVSSWFVLSRLLSCQTGRDTRLAGHPPCSSFDCLSRLSPVSAALLPCLQVTVQYQVVRESLYDGEATLPCLLSFQTAWQAPGSHLHYDCPRCGAACVCAPPAGVHNSLIFASASACPACPLAPHLPAASPACLQPSTS